MKTRQTIAVIGATGNMGTALSKSIAKGNYKLLLFARNGDRVQALAEEIRTENPTADVEPVACSVNASWEADIIILAVPYIEEPAVAEHIREMVSGKIVISMANPLNDSYDALLTAPDTSAAEELQKLLPHSRVIKAFNTSYAAAFSSPIIDEKRADGFIAGNSEDALANVSELVSVAGFRPVLAGQLSVSRTLEQMQLLLIQLSIKNNYNWLAGWKILHN